MWALCYKPEHRVGTETFYICQMTGHCAKKNEHTGHEKAKEGMM